MYSSSNDRMILLGPKNHFISEFVHNNYIVFGMYVYISGFVYVLHG